MHHFHSQPFTKNTATLLLPSKAVNSLDYVSVSTGRFSAFIFIITIFQVQILRRKRGFKGNDSISKTLMASRTKADGFRKMSRGETKMESKGTDDGTNPEISPAHARNVF